MLRAMSNVEGFNFEETLTGFKWMGNRSVILLEQEKEVLFAFEEAIGFMFSPAVLDKVNFQLKFTLFKKFKRNILGRCQCLSSSRYNVHLSETKRKFDFGWKVRCPL